ncbi:MAG: hypothetical protein JWR09_829 [Mucilaginibacter sp.]|nr:hypothetical protein [Mucilaginibacter sp.]
MKKYFLKPFTLKLTTLFALLLAIIIIHSCKKDNKNVPLADPTIAQAKVWYESTYPVKSIANGKLTTQGTGSQDLSQWIKPDWRHSNKYKKLGKDVIEMPIDPSAKFGSAAQIGAGLTNKAYSRSYFLLLNDGKSYTAYIMMVLADSDYVKNDTSKLAHNTYLKNDADFSGKVLYLTPKGEYLGGNAYRNGHLVIPASATQQTGSQKVQSIGNPTLKPDIMVLQCTDWYLDYYVDGVLDHSVYIGRTCASVDNGSGGSGSGGAPPPAPCAPPAPVQNNSVSGSHLIVNFVPPPDPCTPVPPVVQDTVMTDPCSAVKTTAGINTNSFTTGNASVTTAFTAAIGASNSGREAAFHVDKVGSTYTASTPVPSTEASGFSSTNYDTNTTAIGHSHDASSFPQPSPYDIYQLGELAVQHNAITTDLIVSPTAKYAVVVTNLAAFKAFFAKYDESNLAKDANGNFTGDFDDNKQLGKDVNKAGADVYNAYFYSHNINQANATDVQKVAADLAGEEASLVFFVSNYNTGITLLKADASGVFYPLHFTETAVNGVTIYTASPCNED